MINVAYIQTPNSGSILLGNSKSKIAKVQFGDSLLNKFRTGLTGLEPATSAVTGRCSNQLNYSPLFGQLCYYHYFFSACQAFWGEKSAAIFVPSLQGVNLPLYRP
jgi:hypothetical protein